jgi:hypothetical protein
MGVATAAEKRIFTLSLLLVKLLFPRNAALAFSAVMTTGPSGQPRLTESTRRVAQ